jgi:hypothetical protein
MNCVRPRAPADDTALSLNPDSPDASFNNNAAPDKRFPVYGLR